MKPQDEGAISLAEAQALVISKVGVLGTEEVRLEAALGRVLRGQLVSDADYPSENVSAMDGYALGAASCREASGARPVELRIVGSVRAGESPALKVGRGECAAITTGGVLPDGCDAVVKHEDVEVRQSVVVLTQSVAPGDFVRRRGEVVAKGMKISVEGRRAKPATIGLLAAIGANRVAVTRQPAVGVLTTGDEIVPPDTIPAPGLCRNSNGPMLAGLAAGIGCRVVGTSISGDSVEDLVSHFGTYADCDAVVVSGGISGGEFDLVPQALEALGAEIYFDALRMSPGRHVVFAQRGQTAYFCVPGNPEAALAAFTMVARPGLLKMLGLRDVLPASFKARVTAAIEKEADGFAKLVPAGFWRPGPGSQPERASTEQGGTAEVAPFKSRGRGDVITLACADCLVYLGPDRGSVAAGDIVDVILL